MADRTARRAWESARTLDDLGQLTARWLEGTLPFVPGYAGAPDPETLPLTGVLAGLNRAGYVTCASQPADACCGYDGAWWEQRAAVEGFTGPRTAERIVRAAGAAGLITVAYAPADLPRWRIGYGRAVPVTRRNGQVLTRFGAHLSRRHLRDGWTGYGMCHRDAVNAVCGAWQLTVIDPRWDRPDLLWRVLTGTLEVT